MTMIKGLDLPTFKKTFKFICDECGEFLNSEMEYCEKCGTQAVRKAKSADYRKYQKEYAKDAEETMNAWRAEKRIEAADLSEKEKRYCKRCKVEVKYDTKRVRATFTSLTKVKVKCCPYCGTQMTILTRLRKA
jgi:rRNA maturation endonuclease Nob1